MNKLPIPGFSGYTATDEGTVFGKTGALLPGWVDPKQGYLVLRVAPDQGPKKPMRIHALVALAFHGEKPKGAHVRHLDGNKLNNKPSNLEYGTPKENNEDTHRLGRAAIGSRHGMSKLTEEDIPIIRGMRAHGESNQDIASHFHVSADMIRLICEHKNWKHVA